MRALPGEYIKNTQREEIHNDDTLIDNFKQLLPKFELLHYDPREFPNASLNYFIKLSNMKFYKWNLNLHKDH